MSVKNTLLLAAVAAALAGSLAAGAAEEKPTSPKEGTSVEKVTPETPTTEVKAKKVQRHNHDSFHKSGVESTPSAQRPEAPMEPAHDHQKFHK